MTYFCFDEDDLLKIIDLIQENPDLNRESLLSLCIINSSGVNDDARKETCQKCDRRVNDKFEHRKYEGDNSSRWSFESFDNEKINKCEKCKKYVNSEYEHRNRAGNQTYSSSWDC